MDDFYQSRGLPHSLNKNAAFDIGSQEYYGRKLIAEGEDVQAAADLALADAPEWIQILYRQGKPRWGFVCLWDAASQKLDPEWLEEFKDRLEMALQNALRFNGSSDLIDRKWELLHFYAPDSEGSTEMVLIDNVASSVANIQHGAIFRKAFQDILDDPQKYANAQSVPIWEKLSAEDFDCGLAESGSHKYIPCRRYQLHRVRRPWSL